jgi:hypothetical protein
MESLGPGAARWLMAPLRMRWLVLVFVLAAACDDTGPGASGACGDRTGGCAATEYCEYARNSCGTGGEVGSCKPRPTACPLLLVAELTCACDGKVYSSACDALAAGADLDGTGGCTLAANAFTCGYRQCQTVNDYCQRSASDIGNEPDSYACRGRPQACSTVPTCACLASEPCGDMCSGQGETGLTLNCPGG